MSLADHGSVTCKNEVVDQLGMKEVGLAKTILLVKKVKKASKGIKEGVSRLQLNSWICFNKNTWGNVYTVGLKLYHQYCRAVWALPSTGNGGGGGGGRGSLLPVGNFDRLLEPLTEKEVREAVEVSSKAIPDMWLEPHDLAEVHHQYIKVLTDTFGKMLCLSTKL